MESTCSAEGGRKRVSRDEINRIQREKYAANKEKINKRRRELYAERKRHAEAQCYPNVDSQGTTNVASDHDIRSCQLTISIDEINKNRRKKYQADKDNINKRRRELYAEKRRIIEAECSSTRDAVSQHTPNVACDSDIRTDPRTLILPPVPPCQYCGAFKFYNESNRFCCSGGEISLASSVLPAYLVDLITKTDAKSKQFQSMIRTYNNHFAFTSIGMTCDGNYQHRDQGIYTVRIQGQVHHYLNDLLPNDHTTKLQGIQFYFYDPDHQISNRIASLPRLDPYIVTNLVHLMQQNPYAEFLQRVSELHDLDNYHIVIRADPQVDQRTHNIPTSNEAAGIWVENQDDETDQSQLWDIRVYSKSGQSYKVQYYYGCYDPLQYVLMFPNGESGWHGNIARVGCTIRRKKGHSKRIGEDCNSMEDLLQAEEQGVSRRTFYDMIPNREAELRTESQREKRMTVSCREYYVYKLQIRPDDQSYMLRFGRLLQQYVIDIYIKLESMRLAFQRMNQKKSRIEYYQGVVDSVVAGVPHGNKIGKRVYLPPSFIGGPRDMRQRYLDSMALVQEFGKPDLFLTITCNPNWPEIKELLHEGEEAHNRPDLLARVFRAKMNILRDKIKNGEIFGHITSLVHVVEFQKRGLPHAHFLIILKSSSKYLTPEAYDRIVSAELPNRLEDPYAFSLVVKHMMHGPCGDLNPSNVCMKDGRCKNHYPKAFAEQTTHGKGSYPIYRRRNDNKTARVRGRSLDNRWVIPYNLPLLLMFNCHINVEICCDIRAVKYLYKYIHKGHDKVTFRIASDCTSVDVDEITDFQNARWVSPVEAVWRIFGFPLHGMYPSVLQLQVHLPNFQTLHFEEDADLKKLLEDDLQKRSMLTEFFEMNENNVAARELNLLYKEFPKHFIWDKQTRTWSRRKQGVTIGRLCVVNPVENERYYLRVLLNNVRCPTSFNSLLTVNGITYKTFQEAAYIRGLLQSDDDIDKAMEEASLYRMPVELRRLFATLLHYCRPSNARKLFERYFEYMAEDFKRSQEQQKLSNHEIFKKVIQGINDTLETLGRDVNEFNLVSFQYKPSDFERYTREITAERNIPIPEEDLHAFNKLNEEQRTSFHIIFQAAITNNKGLFFVDGPGGTGKSFLYKVLLAHLRSRGFISLIVASSGIASSGFLGGRTAHSRFKIPLDTASHSQCNISFQSSEADLIRSARIIIWDEAPMANKANIYAVDKLLKFLCENNNPFGGKLVVFGGDFRQVLPVVKRGGRKEQIEASVVTSPLWKHFRKLFLTENMRAKHDPGFVDFLMRIGNGTEPVNERGEIEIPKPMLIPYTDLETSIQLLIGYVYPDMSLFEKEPFDMMKRVILSPKNEYVDDINSILIQRILEKEMLYISDDRAKNQMDQGDYIDYLNSLEPKGLPQHKLLLKRNCPVILLRNINPVEGLCNGTRLICKHLLPTVVGAVIATGQFIGKLVWIPRIPLEPNPSDNKYTIPFVRRQLPLRLCFAMTINKSQGQTLDYVGIYLRQPVFTHGQLYVAMSRAKTGNNVKILIVPPTFKDPASKYTANVVYNEILLKATAT